MTDEQPMLTAEEAIVLLRFSGKPAFQAWIKQMRTQGFECRVNGRYLYWRNRLLEASSRARPPALRAAKGKRKKKELKNERDLSKR